MNNESVWEQQKKSKMRNCAYIIYYVFPSFCGGFELISQCNARLFEMWADDRTVRNENQWYGNLSLHNGIFYTLI